MTPYYHFSLFTGIGGIDLAAEWAGFTTVGMCEKDTFCRRVLERHWPTVPIWEDVRDVTGESIRTIGLDRIDLLTGGFPCQPFSVAGKRQGKNDDRFLWPEMLRVVCELWPAWVLGENVGGFIHLALDDALANLEDAGYEAQAIVLPACAVAAPHRRERCFIVGRRGVALGDAGSLRCDSRRSQQPLQGLGQFGKARMGNAENVGYEWAASDKDEPQRDATKKEPKGHAKLWYQLGRSGEGMADNDGIGQRTPRFGYDSARIPGCGSLPHPGQGQPQPGVGGMLDGVSARLDGMRWPAMPGEPQYAWELPRTAIGIADRVGRLKALGNAVVPVQVYPILACIAALLRA